MENSLRNHALVQQQNNQQQQQRGRDDYYRNNGIIRSSSSGTRDNAPVSSSRHGNNSINMNSSRSRTSGSSTSGKGSKSSRSSRSGEASDEAVHPGAMPQHRYFNEHHLHQQQPQQHQHHQQQQHQQQQQQQYHYQQQQHQQQQQQYYQQQRYPQHHHYFNGTSAIGIPQQQQQQDQYGYPIYNDSVSGSQQSSSHHLQFADQATAGSQSHYTNILGSVGGSVTGSNPSAEEAYRRIGLRLSRSAHGGDSVASRSSVHNRATIPNLKSSNSCFKPFEEVLLHMIREQEKEEVSSNGNSNSSSRSSKSKKSTKGGNIIRKMTLNANELFRHWHTEHSKIQHHQPQRRRKNSDAGNVGRSSSWTSKTDRFNGREDMNQHRRAFAQMSLGDGSHKHGHSHNKQPGPLSAVIESASQNSGTTRSISTKGLIKGGGGGHSRGDASRSVRSDDKSRASSTIATHSSIGTRNSFRSFGTLPPRGQCLTQSSEGVSNDNLCDNAEGNLIVYENDNISVPKKQVCVLTPGKIPKGASSSDFRVQSLLGQGTFAQVFRCLHVQTGQLVAVKIVKNKPAYTRQAAVEIDVIRALSTTSPNETTNSMKSNNENNNENNNDRSSKTTTSANEGLSQKNSSDYMIDMVCYFLYKDHLCLVFELLGLNLYEVLKKRQFRGLPLVVTQTLVRQAVLGARDLAQKSIVHCDLKPENILLVDEDNSESVMSAGESKRVHALSLHNKQQIEQQKILGRSTESNRNKDTIEGNNKSNGNDHTNEGQTQSSDKTKSTTETDNMTRKNEERQQQQPITQEKSNGWLATKSPMESTIATIETQQYRASSHHRIKLIDFGSACFEGQMSHTYIQSRFYRSPEVLLGLAYDSAIDMWSLGCVAAELFLGLPILPGVHEHDQLGRIIEMIGDTPDWMLDQGTKSSKYFVKHVPAATPTPPIQSSSATPPIQSFSTKSEIRSGSTEAISSGRSGSEAPRPLPQWRIKTQHEYIASLSHSDIEKKGGLTKLQKQHGNRYFKRKSLSDIILHKGETGKQEDLRLLKSFIHFIYGKN